MTLTERVLALTDQGFNFPTIAAILNITPEQIEEVWGGQDAQLGDPPALSGSASNVSAARRREPTRTSGYRAPFGRR